MSAGREPTGMVAASTGVNDPVATVRTATASAPDSVTYAALASLVMATDVGPAPTATGRTALGAHDFGWQGVNTVTVPSPEFATNPGCAPDTKAIPRGAVPTVKEVGVKAFGSGADDAAPAGIAPSATPAITSAAATVQAVLRAVTRPPVSSDQGSNL